MPVNKIYRLMVLGGPGVGKTALIEQLIFGNHLIGVTDERTVGDIYEALIETEHGVEEAVQLYDTPGNLFSTEMSRDVSYDQEHYLSIGDGIVLVYDISSKSSFEVLKLIRHKISLKHKEFPVVAIGNKYDLDGIRQVKIETALDWAKTEGVQLYEASVLDRESLKEPFSCIAWTMSNPGRVLPVHFHTPFVHSNVRKSFTIPQGRTRNRHTHLPLSKEDPPLLSPPAHSKEDTPSHSKEDTPPPFKDVNKKRSTPKPIPAANYSPSISKGSHSSMETQTGDSPSLTLRSISSDVSEYSIDSRISTRIYPEDALYPRTGLLGLADCMSSRNARERKK